jgi:energy-coupling factor transporter ATP-binding protein EcfA2
MGGGVALPRRDDDFDAAEEAAARQAAGTRQGGGGGPVRLPTGQDFDGSGVSPVGTSHGTYWVVDAAGSLRGIRSRDIIHQSTLLDLWGGEDAWLAANFGFEGRRGDLNIPWDKAGAALMRACHRLGPWDPASFPPRYTGIWSDSQGRPLLHLGDVLLYADGREEPAGQVVVRENAAEHGPPIRERQVYVREAARRRPAPPASTGEIEDLREEIARLWTFRDGPAGAMLVVGWCAVALLGAAIRWRPNLVMLGPSGSGKSSLLGVMRGLLPIHLYTNDTTKSGVETAMTGRPGPLLVDEAAQGDRAYAAALFDMMLPASGGDGTEGRRGAADGHGRAFSVLGAVCYAAIHPPALKPEHQGRFTELVLLQGEGDSSEAMRALQARAARIGPAFFGRALAAYARWGETLRAMRTELVRRGASAREADQVGALLAGWWIMASDAPATQSDAEACAEQASPYIRGRAAQRDDSAGRRAWQALATTTVLRGNGMVRVPLGDLILEAFPKGTDPAELEVARSAEADLRRYGIRCERLAPEPAIRLVRDPWTDDEWLAWRGKPEGCLVVWFGRNHAELRRLFDKGDFAGEAWWRAMEMLPGARRSKGNVRIGKAYSGGAFVIPVAALYLGEEGGPPAPPD